jgi:anti-sigma factor ChrR (cupin superfamily)
MHIPLTVVDEYAAGTLRPEQRQVVDAHTLVCDRCLREVTIAALSLRVRGNICELLFGQEPELKAESADRAVLQQ